MSDHPFWQLVHRGNDASYEERAFLAAVLNLSVTSLSYMPLEQIYEEFYDSPKRERITLEQKILNQLKQMEEKLVSTKTAVDRLQASQDSLKKQLTDTQTALASMFQAQTDANARLEADIANLRNSAGSGDEAALAAIADSLDQTKAGFQAVADQLNAAAAAENLVDQPPVPVPTPTPTLSISPMTVTVVHGGQQQFSANVAVQWAALSGSIDANGLYTAPTDPAIVGDSVTATASDGQTQTASISVVN